MADLYLPLAAIGTLGGTIVSQSSQEGLQPSLDPAELIATIPELKNVARIHAVDWLSKTPSPSITFQQVLDAITWAKQQVANRVDGVVLLQGTDTLEETAFLADLLWDEPTPLVISGAMKGYGSAGYDGGANIVGAVTVAVDTETRDQGVFVVINDEVHMASRVTKTDLQLVNGFASPSTSPIGRILEGRLWLHSRSTTKRPAPLPFPGRTDHRVVVVNAGLGEDFSWLPTLVLQDTSIAGVVVNALGTGHVADVAVDHLATTAESVPVVLASRVLAGSTTRFTYSYPGSEADLLERGFVLAGALHAQQARMLLWLLTGLDVESSDIPAAFALHDPSAPPAWMGLARSVTPRLVAQESQQSSRWKRTSKGRTSVAKARLAGWSKGVGNQSDT